MLFSYRGSANANAMKPMTLFVTSPPLNEGLEIHPDVYENVGCVLPCHGVLQLSVKQVGLAGIFLRMN